MNTTSTAAAATFTAAATAAYPEAARVTFTAADVEAFAAMLMQHLTEATPEGVTAAGRAAWVAANDEMGRQHTRIDAYVNALMGTYDEFRAEAN